MKKNSHRAAALALVVALSISTAAAAAPTTRDRDRDRGDVIVRVIKKISKIFGFTPNDDFPLPPLPKP